MSDDNRVLDLLLQKTADGRIAWRGYSAMPGVGVIEGATPVWPREDVYAAQIKTHTGELVAILHAMKSRPRGADQERVWLTVRDLAAGTEILIESDAATRTKLKSLLDAVRGSDPSKGIIEVLEKV